MNKIYFGLALHFHQPIGNFDNIFKRACNNCYKPFLELLSAYPDLKMTFHLSGCLWDFLDKNEPRIIKLLENMVSRNQIEIMGGGYYEPIFTSISEKDRVGQMDLMSKYIKNKFGVNPKGMWLPERVWDLGLVKSIREAGLRYLILDDEHLIRSGVNKDDIHGYFLTGEDEEKLAVFPSDKNLRYMIPFKMPHEIRDYMKLVSEKRGGVLLTYGDDGEKFGEWPGTHKWVFEEKWLINFFNMLRENSEWIKLIHLSKYLENNKPTGFLNVKQGSYKEMMEWSDGNWLNFFSKYPESNQMNKKMHYISSKLDQIEKRDKLNTNEKIEKAKIQLYMGQCNCSYWHGVFGGLYLYHLRSAVYNHLIEADKILDSIEHRHKRNWLDIKHYDFDLDGKDEVIIENNNFSIYIDPYEGGVIKELDCKPLSFNFVNTLARKKEAYHEKILTAAAGNDDSKVATIHDDFRKVDPALKEVLIYDKYPRMFFRTFFVKKDINLEDLINSDYEELGDFSTGDYEMNKISQGINLKRDSSLLDGSVRLNKQIQMKSKDEIEFICIVKKINGKFNDLVIAAEFNFTMPYLNSDRYCYNVKDRRLGGLEEKGCCNNISNLDVFDSVGGSKISFEFIDKAEYFFYFPIKTVSQSEKAYELNYQGSCILPAWRMNFNTKNEFKFKINFIFNNL